MEHFFAVHFILRRNGVYASRNHQAIMWNVIQTFFGVISNKKLDAAQSDDRRRPRQMFVILEIREHTLRWVE